MLNSIPAEQNIRVLIVDDDHDIRLLLSDFLERNGLQVWQAADGESMWQSLQSQPVDMVVLDLNLPGTDGIALCRELRTTSNLPVIMLTARTSPIDRIVGLETGADDYVCKPFEPLELLSRIRSVLRRVTLAAAGEYDVREPRRMRFSGWTLELTARHLLDPRGVVISLSGAEFRLLKLFLDRPNRILSRDAIMEHMHGRESGPFDRSIDLQVSRLRQKIEENSKMPTLLKTIRNEGYLLASAVEVER